MKDIHDIILGPVLTEKSYDQIPMKKYTFKVATRRQQNRNQIRDRGDFRRAGGERKHLEPGWASLRGRAIHRGRTAKVKKAVVTLKKDSKGDRILREHGSVGLGGY